MTPFSGDLVGRVLAARQGRSAKCLVLDLDNTLWGCVICGRPALLATTYSAVVLLLLAGGAERTTHTLVSAPVATKLTAQMGNIHSPHINIVAVSTKEYNYAI